MQGNNKEPQQNEYLEKNYLKQNHHYRQYQYDFRHKKLLLKE